MSKPKKPAVDVTFGQPEVKFHNLPPLAPINMDTRPGIPMEGMDLRPTQLPPLDPMVVDVPADGMGPDEEWKKRFPNLALSLKK